jgi:hypothetical protein
MKYAQRIGDIPIKKPMERIIDHTGDVDPADGVPGIKAHSPFIARFRA